MMPVQQRTGLFLEQYRPFLAAIRAEPDADLPRLAFADFLEETDQRDMIEFAQYIRWAIVEQSPANRPHKIRSPWLAEDIIRVSVPDTTTSLRLLWRRGFPYAMCWSTRRPPREWSKVIALYPITDLRITLECDADFQAVSPYLDDNPGLDLITTLQVQWLPGRQLFPEADTLLCAHCTGLQNLTSLDFSKADLDDALLLQIVSSLPRTPYAASLKHLTLATCHNLTDASANTLATARSLRHLETLDVRNVPFSPLGWQLLEQRYGSGLSRYS
jgi:uncharacterized protein (TIGR02996 family)